MVDASGNIYVVGNATGNFGSQLNQGTQDVYLTKYDSAGNVVWQNLLGSAGTANGYGLALDPSGGVVVTGASTADLTTTSVADGNNDFFVARYDASGNQTWIKQIQTLATNQSNAVSVDASGNIYIGGTRVGRRDRRRPDRAGRRRRLSRQIRFQGQAAGRKPVRHQRRRSGRAPPPPRADGSLYVASVQNGHAIVAKYAGGDITSAPVWTQDLGALAAAAASAASPCRAARSMSPAPPATAI